MENWIKNLVQQENKMEASGQMSFQSAIQPSEEDLKEHTIEFLKQLRTAFTQNISVFNQLKGYMGSIRIYGIIETESDFMLFRNGYKLVFFMKGPGLIAIRFSNSENSLPGQDSHSTHQPCDYLKGTWGSFGELKWTHNNQPIRIDYLVRFYITHFVKQSVR